MSVGIYVSSLSHLKNTLYAMVTTFLFNGTRDFVDAFPEIPVDNVTGHRVVQFEGKPIAVVNRAIGDLMVYRGAPISGTSPEQFTFNGAVNLYFGDAVAIKAKDLPQRMVLPVAIHLLMPYTAEHRVGEAQAERLAEAVENSFQGIGGRQPMFDFYVSPAQALVGRFVSWAREYRGTWRELGDPTKEAFTNRQWSFQVRYVR